MPRTKKVTIIQRLEEMHGISAKEMKDIILTMDHNGILVSTVAQKLGQTKTYVLWGLTRDRPSNKALQLLFPVAVKLKEQNEKQATEVVEYLNTAK